MANKLLLNHSGGMNVKTSPLIIKDNECELALNYHLDKLGALTKRNGYTTYLDKLNESRAISATLSGSVDWRYIAAAIKPSGTSVPALSGSVSTNTSSSGASTTTLSHTVAASLSNSLLVVYATNPAGSIATGATWNGVAMTALNTGSVAGSLFSKIFYLVAPAAATANVVVTWASSRDERSVVALTLTGVNQTTPIDTSNENSGTSTSPSVTIISSTDNTLVLGGLMNANATVTLNQPTSLAALTTSTTPYKVTLASSSGAPVTINGLYQFYDESTGGLEQITVANNQMGNTGVLWFNASGSWSQGKTDDTASKKTRFSTFVDYVFRVNGSNVVATSANGSVWGTTNAPATITPSYTAVFQDRVYLANGVSSNLSRLWFSSLPSAGAITWTTASDFIDINPDDGDKITALENNGNRLLIFKNRSMYRWTFGQVEPDRLIGVGTQSQESVKTNFDVGVTFFANQFGVYAYTSGRPKLISRKIQQFVDAVSDWSNVFAEVDNDHYYLAVGNITVDGRAFNNAMFVYHISLDAWTVYTTAARVTWMARLADTNGGPESVYLGTNEGRTFKFLDGTSDYTSNAPTTIPSEMRSKEYLLSYPERTNFAWLDVFALKRVEAQVFYDLDRLDAFGDGDLGQITTRVSNFRIPVRECNSVRVKVAENSSNTVVLEGFNMEHYPKEKRDEQTVKIRRRGDV